MQAHWITFNMRAQSLGLNSIKHGVLVLLYITLFWVHRARALTGAASQSPVLTLLSSAVTILKSLTIVEQGVLHFRFAPSPVMLEPVLCLALWPWAGFDAPLTYLTRWDLWKVMEPSRSLNCLVYRWRGYITAPTLENYMQGLNERVCSTQCSEHNKCSRNANVLLMLQLLFWQQTPRKVRQRDMQLVWRNIHLPTNQASFSCSSVPRCHQHQSITEEGHLYLSVCADGRPFPAAQH